MSKRTGRSGAGFLRAERASPARLKRPLTDSYSSAINDRTGPETAGYGSIGVSAGLYCRHPISADSGLGGIFSGTASDARSTLVAEARTPACSFLSRPVPGWPARLFWARCDFCSSRPFSPSDAASHRQLHSHSFRRRWPVTQRAERSDSIVVLAPMSTWMCLAAIWATIAWVPRARRACAPGCRTQSAPALQQQSVSSSCME
jgi:hypothetical protein